jgi:hypothetical protein
VSAGLLGGNGPTAGPVSLPRPVVEVRGEECGVPLMEIREDGVYSETLAYTESEQTVWTQINPFRQPYTHNVSINNERLAVINRLLRVTPEPTQGFPVMRLKVAVVEKAGRWETAKRIDATKTGHRYAAAAASLASEPMQRMDWKLKLFIKVEKHYKSPVKEPRTIQHRQERYTLELARYLQPLEDAFISHYSALRYNTQEVYTTKGLTNEKKATAISEHWDRVGVWALCLDFSRFDCHVTLDALKATHAWYKAHYPGDDYLSWLLSKQEETKGKTALGTMYRRVGGLCSGDIDTSLGNTLINITLLRTITDALIIAEGDDSIIIGTPEQVLRAKAALDSVSSRFGFKLEGEIAYSLEEIDYCSARVTKCGMVRIWPKPVTTDGWSVSKYPDKVKAYISRSMAISMLYAYHEQPVYDKLALNFWARSKEYAVKRTYALNEGIKGVNYSASLEHVIARARRDKSPDTRASFAMATDVSPHEQRALERKLAIPFVRVGRMDTETLESLRRRPNQMGSLS